MSLVSSLPIYQSGVRRCNEQEVHRRERRKTGSVEKDGIPRVEEGQVKQQQEGLEATRDRESQMGAAGRDSTKTNEGMRGR